MSQADQEARQEMVALWQAGGATDSAAMAPVQAHVDSVDVGNTARLRQLIHRYGWPSRRRVGRDGADAAFLLAQHADRAPAFQKCYLSFLRKAFRDGDETGDHLALLTDRVRTAKGLEQLYGTQAKILNDSVTFLSYR